MKQAGFGKKLLAETVEQFKATTGDEPCSAYEIYCGICESITIARQEKTNERGLLALEEKIAGCVSKRWEENMKVTNGKDVARLLVDEYLNCHPTGHKKFMESMAKEQQEIKDNYTYLGFAWLKGLSEVRYYDLRNEASKLMADDLCLHVKEQPERVRLVYDGAEEMEINPSDEEQMAKMFTCYLLAGSMDGYGEFVDYALDTHRTLQQNLTRFFVEWFAKAEKGSAFLKRAKMVYSRYSLPYI